MNINWCCLAFEELTAKQVFEMLYLRQEVFILEQQILCQEADQWDYLAYHILGYNSEDQQIAYARILPPDTRFPEVSIGRVLTKKSFRGAGIGKNLMHFTIEKCGELYPDQLIKLSSQVYIQQFYEGLGFIPVGETYIEEGIKHITMFLKQK